MTLGIALREFLSQSNLIVRSNEWSNSAKTVILALYLREKAHVILDRIAEIESITFSELKTKLELYFDERYSTHSYYLQFTNRKQKYSEDLASLGTEIERLTRLAYPEYTLEMRDKITSTQFISALTDGFINRTLQLKGINFLKSAVERSITIKTIQENNFEERERKREGGGNNLKRKYNFFDEAGKIKKSP